MNNKKPDSSPAEVELVVTQTDYEAALKRGWTDDDMLEAWPVQIQARRISGTPSGIEDQKRRRGRIGR